MSSPVEDQRLQQLKEAEDEFAELRVLHEDASEGQPAASHNRASLAGDSQDLLDMDDEAGRPKRAAPATALGATPVPLTIGEQPAKYTRGEAKGDTKGDQRNEAGAAEANEQLPTVF